VLKLVHTSSFLSGEKVLSPVEPSRGRRYFFVALTLKARIVVTPQRKSSAASEIFDALIENANKSVVEETALSTDMHLGELQASTVRTAQRAAPIVAQRLPRRRNRTRPSSATAVQNKSTPSPRQLASHGSAAQVVEYVNPDHPRMKFTAKSRRPFPRRRGSPCSTRRAGPPRQQ
jgi:hypothetical protein